MNLHVCECGWKIHSRVAITVTCPKCKSQVVCSGVPPKKRDSVLPNWVRLVRMIRIPSDIGIGDTLQRQFANYGGERFKEWATKLGIDCGCTERQNHYNKKYPYQ